MSKKPKLRIVVVGAGLGGLAAAFCFARSGHYVQVLEQRESPASKGGGIMIRPGASRILLSWGLAPDFEAVADDSPAAIVRNVKDGTVLLRNIAVEVSEYPDWGTTRQATHQILHNHARKAGADLVFGAAVQDVQDDSDTASITMKNGQVLIADMIIVADGIRSRLRPKVLADIAAPIEPLISDLALCGVTIPVDEIKSNKEALKLAESIHLNVWMGEGGYVVGRLNQKEGTWGALFGITAEDRTERGLWDERGDIEHLRRTYANMDPALRAALDMAHTCDRWKLAEMPNLPRWTSKQGRVILLGDCAHGMRPNAAQGFSQIVEDIGVLEYLVLQHPSLSIPAITEIWQTIRKPRVERIKAYAAWNASTFVGDDSSDLAKWQKETASHTEDLGQTKSMKGVRPDATAKFQKAAFLKWALDYDAVEEAKKYLAQRRPKM